MAVSPEMKENFKKLLTDSVTILKSAEDMRPRRAIGTMMFAAAHIAVMDGMTREDFLQGCQTGWLAAKELVEHHKKEKANAHSD